MPDPFAYDAVEYPSVGLAQMHPGHLFAVARMFGCQPARPDACRYLELGCGDGTHLIACAMGLPNATFVGVDLSAVAVDKGNRLIADLGLKNVTLHAADVTVWSPPAGGFDYAAAHGLYSWVPEFVREAVMATVSTALAPHGIGYVSYNTYPGCYIRRMVWEMLQFHTKHLTDPTAKIDEATAALRFLLAGQPKENRKPGSALFAHELEHLLTEHDPRVLYHDDLSGVNDPVYFHQFDAHAKKHGLRFVAEAEHVAMETRSVPDETADTLDGLASQNVVLKEQYLDFLKLRRFRQTLLAKDGRPPLAQPDPAALPDLAVSGNPTAGEKVVDVSSPTAAVTFRRKEAVVRTDSPVGKAALLVLAERWPKRVPFAELVTAAAGKLGRPVPTDDDRRQLAELLAQVWMTGLIDLHGNIPAYADKLSERPTACPLARAQVGRGAVTTRLFTHMRFDDEPSRRMVELLDGTRTLDEVAKELAGSFPPDKRPDPQALTAGLAQRLAHMARGGLLVG